MPYSQFAAKNEQHRRLRKLADENRDTEIRGTFARDRDRILYSKGFRRLANKTQVYFSGSGNEHMHTRLSHTLEVAHIAKSISNKLGMNADLVEAISFGHDVGHSPFGHAGEGELNRFLAGYYPIPSVLKTHFIEKNISYFDIHNSDDPILYPSGFQHSFQSVRMLTFLETYDITGGSVRDGIFEDGYNLNMQTLDGILHHTSYKIEPNPHNGNLYPCSGHDVFAELTRDEQCAFTVEGQIVAVADEIAQLVHDFHDAIEKRAFGLYEFVRLPEIQQILEKCINEGYLKVSARFMSQLKELHESTKWAYCNDRDFDRRQIYEVFSSQLCSVLMGYFVRDAVEAFQVALDRCEPDEIGMPLVEKQRPTSPFFEALKRKKTDIVVNNYEVNRMDNKGRYIIRRLVKAYLSDPRQLPDSVIARYMLIKFRQLRSNSELFNSRIDQVSKNLIQPEGRLTPENRKEIRQIITRHAGAEGFRWASKDLTSRLFPYMALDSDFLRAVVDHIACMTDRYAILEVNKLYF